MYDQVVPLCFDSRQQTWLQNFFSLVPLALILGEVTEDLAVRFGDTAGGLLNATFGNITELILSIAALTKGLNIVVAMSLIGSVLSNMLLVLGTLQLFSADVGMLHLLTIPVTPPLGGEVALVIMFLPCCKLQDAYSD